MALRVLLADESHTIKKVFQLSLQDYGAEVRSVNSGSEVFSQISSFSPDIIFADILLQKKNGYEISLQIKNSEHKNIPVVLMWSGFMNLDEKKFSQSKANSKLEKPFEMESLRSIVQKFVKKTQSQNLSSYVDFPEMPEIEEDSARRPISPEKIEQTNQKTSSPSIRPKKSLFDEQEENMEVNADPPSFDSPKKEEHFDLFTEDKSGDDIEADLLKPSSPFYETETPFPEQQKKISLLPDSDNPLAEDKPTNFSSEINSIQFTGLNKKQIEEIVTKEAQKIIEQTVLKLVPELANKLIDAELRRLLSEE